MCPATPSLNPNFANRRNADATRCLRCNRSSPTVWKLGGEGVFAILTSDRVVVVIVSSLPSCSGRSYVNIRRHPSPLVGYTHSLDRLLPQENRSTRWPPKN